VSVMTHYEARNIEAGASWVPYSVQPPSTGLQNSNRNKIGGVAKTKSEEFTNGGGSSSIQPPASPRPPKPGPFLVGLSTVASLPAEADSSRRLGEGGSLQNLIATPANRNALNSPDVNKTYRSNRNKIRGVSASFSDRRNRS